MKTCSKCQRSLPDEAFCLSADRGRGSYCGDCRRAYYASRRGWYRARYLASRTPCPKCGVAKDPSARTCKSAECANRRRERCVNWKGGRRPRQGGYIQVYAPEHPDANQTGYVLEHRLVMERVLGRRLLKSENIHHKNGVRDDNRPENLEMWVKTQPCGQRPEDLVAFAHEILARYGSGVTYPTFA